MISRCAIFLCISLAIPTHTQARMSDVICDDSTRLIKTLKETRGAKRHGTGLRDPETMLEVWVTVRNGDWVIVQNYANGTSCIIAMGEHWEGSLTNPA